jgi:hypothetical protein
MCNFVFIGHEKLLISFVFHVMIRGDSPEGVDDVQKRNGNDSSLGCCGLS